MHTPSIQDRRAVVGSVVSMPTRPPCFFDLVRGTWPMGRRIVAVAVLTVLVALLVPQSAQAAPDHTSGSSHEGNTSSTAGLAPGALTRGARFSKKAPDFVIADGSRSRKPVFQPGLIISDDSFFNDQAMTVEQIQSFFETIACIPRDDAPCLSEFRQNTVGQPEEFDHCSAYRGARNEQASRIIAKVATACGISPHVLIVLLQKEQSLITRPTAYGYQRATGYACPDSAACDTKYFGFFNQVYNAAWQFREYGASSDWRYHVGRVAIQYSPNASCGSSIVDIRNQATANLYNYTPYQPDAATLAHANAQPTPCSAYGNLNFSRIYTGWFGDPTATRLPDWWGDCLTFTGGHGCGSDLTAVTTP